MGAGLRRCAATEATRARRSGWPDDAPTQSAGPQARDLSLPGGQSRGDAALRAALSSKLPQMCGVGQRLLADKAEMEKEAKEKDTRALILQASLDKRKRLQAELAADNAKSMELIQRLKALVSKLQAENTRLVVNKTSMSFQLAMKNTKVSASSVSPLAGTSLPWTDRLTSVSAALCAQF
ncbi:hypothetical protein CYMTET_18394 [Cymbomonas tetramitiformis]|uniref:Uncharacterized protein n=1 Tax=Cymbomonas tetramitiformis TaxID=36881 RepID=A0AAE0L5Z3_9CHLO|nr:hypothetical protein CYMTET_18394 [Cymbomonas tetramitiformis]